MVFKGRIVIFIIKSAPQQKSICLSSCGPISELNNTEFIILNINSSFQISCGPISELQVIVSSERSSFCNRKSVENHDLRAEGHRFIRKSSFFTRKSTENHDFVTNLPEGQAEIQGNRGPDLLPDHRVDHAFPQLTLRRRQRKLHNSSFSITKAIIFNAKFIVF